MGAFQSQPNNYSCGIMVTFNVLNALGITASYDDIKHLSGCTARMGTTRKGVLRALKGLGADGTPYRTTNPENAWKYVRRWASSSPLVLLVDNHQHYFAITGMMGDRVIVVDSGARIKGNEFGAFPYTKSELLERWIHRGACYAIRVSKP